MSRFFELSQKGLEMRKAIIAMIIGTLLAGFSGGTTFSAANGTERPWRASGTGIGMDTADGFTIDGTSINTYLGKATFHAVSTSDGGSIATVTAANGDELKLVFAPSGDAFFSGGTGRFADASGTFINTFVVESLPDGTFTIEFTQTGTISF
jgi:hypothetical protein